MSELIGHKFVMSTGTCNNRKTKNIKILSLIDEDTYEVLNVYTNEIFQANRKIYDSLFIVKTRDKTLRPKNHREPQSTIRGNVI